VPRSAREPRSADPSRRWRRTHHATHTACDTHGMRHTRHATRSMQRTSHHTHASQHAALHDSGAYTTKTHGARHSACNTRRNAPTACAHHGLAGSVPCDVSTNAAARSTALRTGRHRTSAPYPVSTTHRSFGFRVFFGAGGLFGTRRLAVDQRVCLLPFKPLLHPLPSPPLPWHAAVPRIVRTRRNTRDVAPRRWPTSVCARCACLRVRTSRYRAGASAVQSARWARPRQRQRRRAAQVYESTDPVQSSDLLRKLVRTKLLLFTDMRDAPEK
jgi:hypothetical protein